MVQTMPGGPAELVRALILLEDVKSSFQITPLSAVIHMTLLVHTLPARIMCDTTAEHDALLEWALVPTIVGKGSGTARIASPD